VNSPTPKIGFIAQELEHIDYVVTTHPDYCPNIYDGHATLISPSQIRLSKSINDLSLNLDVFPFKVSCYVNGNLKELNVTKFLDEFTFCIESEITEKITDNSGNYVFVIGQYADNLLTIDKDSIFTLNVAATKQLDQELQETKELVKTQQSQIDSLTQQLAELKSLVQTLIP
jgi:hypothetical protein